MPHITSAADWGEKKKKKKHSYAYNWKRLLFVCNLFRTSLTKISILRFLCPGILNSLGLLSRPNKFIILAGVVIPD